MDEKPSAAEWVMVGACVAMLGLLFACGCVAFTSPVHMQFGGHGHGQANTGSAARQEQLAPRVRPGQVKVDMGGFRLAVPTTRPTD